jgi:hypothetical protein
LLTGFGEAYKRCCTGDCTASDACADPSQHVIFDSIHPTDAAWKAVTNLYTYSQGFTKGPTLASWIQKNKLQQEFLHGLHALSRTVQ